MKTVSAATMRALDARTIAAGASGYELMTRAGEGAFREMQEFLEDRLLPHRRRAYAVLAGKGNNGGDAYVVADRLARTGHSVAVYAVCPAAMLTGDAGAHAQRLPETVPVTVVDDLPPQASVPGTVLVDGLLGTGTQGAPRPPYDRLIGRVNASGCPVVAIDMPSGLDADTGVCQGAAVRADLTVTMGLPKTGMLTPSGLRHCGCLRCVDIGIPPACVEEAPGGTFEAVLRADAEGLARRRPRDAHKGLFGHLLVVGGSSIYGGAPVLAGEAAMRSGAGWVSLALPADCRPLCRVSASLIVSRLPSPGDGGTGDLRDELTQRLAGSAAVVLGPGMGTSPEALAAVRAVLAGEPPVVVDADGLRCLATHPEWVRGRRRQITVLTPHPGEMRLLQQGFGCSAGADADRPGQALELARLSGCTVVLKGMGTVIAMPDGRAAVNTSGSPALATAGTGDVLAGILGALLAQNRNGWDAARLGVFVHGLAGELAPGAECAMTADDLVNLLPRAWQEVSWKA